jgi:hypothetical protein
MGGCTREREEEYEKKKRGLVGNMSSTCLMWSGDMLMKKTDVRAGSTFSFTQPAHVVSTFRYASFRTSSS